jgi:hypothetical protein
MLHPDDNVLRLDSLRWRAAGLANALSDPLTFPYTSTFPDAIIHTAT